MMKRLYVVVGLSVLMFAHGAQAKTTQLDYVEGIVKQIHFVEQSNQVWPGFHPGNTPSIIQFEDQYRNTSAYALNFKPNHTLGWVLLDPANAVYFLQDSSVLDINSGGGFAVVDGQKSFVVYEDAKYFTAIENFVNNYMMRRATYYLGNESKIDPVHVMDLQIPYEGFNDSELVKLMYLEDAALTLAQQDDSAAAEDALRDAVAIHQYRNQLLTESAKQYENASEIIKGVPIYISWTSKQLSDADYRKMTQRTGCTPLNSMLDAKTMIECSNSSFPAFVSSVFGHALDKKLTNQEWKNNVEIQFKSISRTIIDYYHFTGPQAEGMAKQAMQKPGYHYDRIVRIIDHAMLPYLDGMKAAVNDYQHLSGNKLRLPYEYGEVIMLMSMFKNVFDEYYLVNSKTTLFKNVDIALPINEGDQAEIFRIDHASYVPLVVTQKNLSGEVDANASFVEFNLTDKAELILDGKSILASEYIGAKKVQSFNKLIIIDGHLRIPVLSKGTLDASDGILKVRDASKEIKKYLSLH